ncbi:MAG: hypothetical protein E7048_08780 [Lentisphaerae bacterium]|nr:hypothetical protein [Lentisphaerota bacterium]
MLKKKRFYFSTAGSRFSAAGRNRGPGSSLVLIKSVLAPVLINNKVRQRFDAAPRLSIFTIYHKKSDSSSIGKKKNKKIIFPLHKV